MSLDDRLGRPLPDRSASRRDRGDFVGRRTSFGRSTVKPPGPGARPGEAA